MVKTTFHHALRSDLNMDLSMRNQHPCRHSFLALFTATAYGRLKPAFLEAVAVVGVHMPRTPRFRAVVGTPRAAAQTTGGRIASAPAFARRRGRRCFSVKVDLSNSEARGRGWRGAVRWLPNVEPTSERWRRGVTCFLVLSVGSRVSIVSCAQLEALREAS